MIKKKMPLLFKEFSKKDDSDQKDTQQVSVATLLSLGL